MPTISRRKTAKKTPSFTSLLPFSIIGILVLDITHKDAIRRIPSLEVPTGHFKDSGTRFRLGGEMGDVFFGYVADRFIRDTFMARKEEGGGVSL